MTQRSRVLASGLALVVSWCGAPARADDFYVSPTGDDDNSGTMAAPFGTVDRAQTAASAGDTVFIRGGVYEFSGTSATIGVAFTKSGSTDQPINYFAYPGETPVFDLFDLTPQQRVTGLDVHCNWIHIRGLEVRGVRQLIVGDSWGVRVRGDHNVIEHLHVHDNEAPGIFITSGASNLVLNCDSHHNYDPLEGGGNADGFGCHSTGQGNVMRGCRAWENSDDGFDFINAAGACTVEQSWAFRNGWIPDTDDGVGNGAGFKSGGYGNPPNTPGTGAARHVIRFNVAFNNRAIGFYANYHPGGLDFINNTSFNNPSNYDMRTAGGTSSHTLRNNIAAGSGNEIVSFNGGTDDFNSWTLPITVSNDDFVSLDTTQAYVERNDDGSLPSMTLARLRDDSDLIDKGEGLDFPFAGSAPDLGAFEVGLPPPVEPTDGGTPDSGVDPEPDSGVAGEGGVGGTAAGAGGAAGASGVGGAAGMNAMSSSGTGGTSMMQPQPAGGMSSPMIGAAGVVGDGDAESTGCGCRVGRSTRSTPAALLMLSALFTLIVRSRRRTIRTSRLALALLCLGAWACSTDDAAPSTNGGQGAVTAGGVGGTGGLGGAGGVAGVAGAGGTAGGAGAGGAAGTTAGTAAGAGGVGGSGGTAGESPDDMNDGGPDADVTPTDPDGLWIAPDGDDDNPGTEAMPFATLAKAVESVVAGSTIWVKPGSYAIGTTVGLPANGTEAEPINIFAAPGARPVLDFAEQPRGESSARGIQITGTYWHLRGLDVINAGDNCIHISGAHNTIERVNTYGCSDTGVQITANSSDAADDTRAAYNTVINCDSHDNYDEANAGENADGFAAKLYIGPGNVFRGCRAWNNADDGWDLFASDDVVVIEDCWAISNGKIGPAQNNTNGDGNGFKLGGAAKAGDANMGGAVHEVSNCVSIENRACGFVRNNNTLEPELSMCGGRGDGKGLLCSLSNSGAITVGTTASEAINAERESDGSLPPLP